MSQEKLLTLLIKRFEQEKEKDIINQKAIWWVFFFQKINFVLVVALSLLLFTFGLGGIPKEELNKPIIKFIFLGFLFLFLSLSLFISLLIVSEEQGKNPRHFYTTHVPGRRRKYSWNEDKIKEAEEEIIEELKNNKKTIEELKEGLEKTKN